MTNSKALTLTTVLICAGAIVSLSMGVRHGFGLWQLPMISANSANAWTRETFAFAIALQNLVWGVAGPFTGMLIDKYGAPKIVAGSLLTYALGLALIAVSSTGIAFAGSAGILIGLALSGATFTAVIGVVGRLAPPEKRSWALGMVSAMGSFGQFLMVPVEQGLIAGLGWQGALYALAICLVCALPLVLGLREPPRAVIAGGQSVKQAITEAFTNKSFLWLLAGYSVCGFQVVFIGQNIPAIVRDAKFDAQVGVNCLMLIGLFNVIGSYTAGVLGGKFPKKYVLSSIYFGRSILVILFMMVLPLTTTSLYVFCALMGLLWLSTVPLTSGVIGTVFGVQYMAMLSGAVFFSHQIGSFVGMWLSGIVYDATGSYGVMWWVVIALGIGAGLANLPILEKPLARLQAA